MSVIGPTTWNDFVVPGYRVTKMPVNLSAWQSLPDSTIRNWADMTSYTTTNPCLTQLGLNAAGLNGAFFANRLNELRINRQIEGIATTLASLEAQLTSLVENDQLTDTQKDKLKAELEEIKTLKEEIEEVLASGQPTPEDLQELSKKVIKRQQSVSKLIEKITKEVQNSSDDVDTTNNNSENSQNNDSNETNAELEFDKDGRPTSLGTAPTKAFLREMCDTFHDAVNDETLGFLGGTDSDNFHAVLNTIDANNVIEVMQYWNKNYGNSTDDTFLDNFLGDAEHYEKRKYGKKIMNALIIRAEALGIDDEIDKDVAEARSEFSDGNISKHLIKRFLGRIIDKIEAKEKANASEYEQKLEELRTNNQQHDDEEANEAKTTFIGDMREIWEDDELEISDKVKYENGKFSIRIQGEIYEASSFKALVKKIENDGLDPKKYLVKQGLNTQA